MANLQLALYCLRSVASAHRRVRCGGRRIARPLDRVFNSGIASLLYPPLCLSPRPSSSFLHSLHRLVSRGAATRLLHSSFGALQLTVAGAKGGDKTVVPPPPPRPGSTSICWASRRAPPLLFSSSSPLLIMPDLNSVPPSPHSLAASRRRSSHMMMPPPPVPQSPSLNILPSNQGVVGHARTHSRSQSHGPWSSSASPFVPYNLPSGSHSQYFSSPDSGPVRHPRPLTATELHMQLEKEQEAVVRCPNSCASRPRGRHGQRYQAGRLTQD